MLDEHKYNGYHLPNCNVALVRDLRRRLDRAQPMNC